MIIIGGAKIIRAPLHPQYWTTTEIRPADNNGNLAGTFY
jgi:hypothetical protein